jgi:general secretion pathway protein K
MTRRLPATPRRGAALLVAMVLLTLVATLAAGMVWQQWRAVQVEIAERGRAQTLWILNGALDWARLILREDARSGKPTSLNEPWATPLAEARLSSFLAADRDNNADSGPEAFLSGGISDAQSHFNLRNLYGDGKVDAEQVAAFERLCGFAGLPAETAGQLAGQLLAADLGSDSAAPLPPQSLADLVWLGVTPAMIEQLAPWVTLLPVRTPVNLNTAPAQVLASVIEGIGLGGGERLVQSRQRQPFKTLEEAKAVLGESAKLKASDVGVLSNYFEVRGRLRLDDHVLEEMSLVERRGGLEVTVIRRQRSNSLTAAVGG